jgi:hypothetical protein
MLRLNLPWPMALCWACGPLAQADCNWTDCKWSTGGRQLPWATSNLGAREPDTSKKLPLERQQDSRAFRGILL